MNPLRVDSVRAEGGTVLSLFGELDLSTVALAEDALFQVENESDGRLMLDLSHLSFIDSTGLRFVLTAHARTVQRNRPFAIVRGPEAVQRVFVLTRLEERLPFIDAPDTDGGGGGAT